MNLGLHIPRGQTAPNGQQALRRVATFNETVCALAGVWKPVAVLFGALLAAGALASQQPQTAENDAQDPGMVLRQTVRRVRVDVVVTDDSGRPVAGLKASDFHVAENGKPQPVQQFEWQGGETEEAPLLKPPELPSGTFMNLPTAPEHGPLTVLLYDTLNTPLNDQLNARARMVDFLKKNEGRRLAIFVLGDRLRILQGFTANTSLLARVVSGIGPSRSRLAPDAAVPGVVQPHSAMQSSFGDASIANSPTLGPGQGPGQSGRTGMIGGPSKIERDLNDMLENAASEQASEMLDQRVDITLDALAQIGRYLSGFDGRKNLIWYSGAFPAGVQPDPGKTFGAIGSDRLLHDDAPRNYSDRLRKATDRLTAAEVAVYPVDARGLTTGVPMQKASAEFGTMDLLAEQTGGRAFYNSNALEQALESAAVDGSSYYSILYAPSNPKFDGSIRHIKVTLARGGYSLAYRRTYFADDLDFKTHAKADSKTNSKTAGRHDATPVEALPVDAQFGAPLTHELVFAAHVESVEQPAPATPEQIVALASYRDLVVQAEAKKAPRRAPNPAPMQRYEIGYAVLASGLKIPVSADGAYHSDLSFAVLAYDEDGEALWGTKTRLEDSIPTSKIQDIKTNGFRALQRFAIPVSVAVLRFIVRDENSGRTGSMEIRLPLAPNKLQ